MRIQELPSPGRINHAHELRRLCAQAISYHQTQRTARGDKPAADAKELMDFFFACHEAMVPVTAEAGE